MEPANLIALPGEAEHRRSCSLLVRGSRRPSGTGIYVSSKAAASGLLTSQHETTCEISLIKTTYGFYRLAPDNPFLTPDQLAALDSRGCIKEGAVVQAGDILASVVHVRHALKGEAAVPSGMQRVCNDSLETPPGWSGALVKSVQVFTRRDLPRTTPPDVAGKVIVQLIREEDLALGDILTADSSPLGVVAKADQELPASVDLELDAAGTRALSLHENEVRRIDICKGEELSRDCFHARALGPYSIISARPLGAKMRAGGFEVRKDQVRWMRDHGMVANLGEFTSLKCDDLSSRTETRSAYVNNGVYPTPGMPESLRVVEVHLWALGLVPLLESDRDHVDLTVRVANRADVHGKSSGEVKRPETLNYKTLKPTEGGLFCEKIFGQWGSPQRERFGHIQLASPFIPMHWRIGAPSPLQSLLSSFGLSKADIESIVRYQKRVLRTESGKLDLVDCSKQSRIDGVQDLGSGGTAILALLEFIAPDAIPTGLRGKSMDIVADAFLVIPADYRPLIPLQNGDWATSDLNDLYRRVINRNNRLKKLIELKAPETIILNERAELQRSCDALYCNVLLDEDQAELEQGRRLKRISEMLQFYGGNDCSAKRVDFSARARAILDERIANGTAKVPAEIFKTFKVPEGRPLLFGAHKSAQLVALVPTAVESSVVALPRDAFNALEVSGSWTVDVHRPLGEASCREAEDLLRGEKVVLNSEMHSSWIDADGTDLLLRLVNSVLQGSTAHMDTPRGLLIGGTGSLRRADTPPRAADLVRANNGESALDEKYRLITAPAVPVVQSHDLMHRMRDVVDSYRRPACVFELIWTTNAPTPVDGAWGNLPWLPMTFEWPSHANERLRFVVQLPLDAAITANIDVLSADQGSLLTMFWGDDWWEQKPASLPIIQILKTSDKLEQFCIQTQNAPVESKKPRTVLKPVIREEVPAWPEMADLLRVELDVQTPELKKFEAEEWGKFPAASNGLKLGGWPAWIQGVYSTEPLILQVPSNEHVGLVFGDCGRLYAMGAPNRGFSVIMQYY